MAVGKNKKRYNLTLTESNVERFQGYVREFGLSPNTMSRACDDILRDLNDIFQDAKEKGKFGIDDLFRVMGTQLQLLQEEERRERDVFKQKQDSVSKSKNDA